MKNYFMITEKNLIEFVTDKLKNYPNIEFKLISSKRLKIYKTEDNGFDILLSLENKENTLYLGDSHWHFGKTDKELNELLKYLLFSLTLMTCIKEYSKNRR
jgi:hypothetical protein